MTNREKYNFDYFTIDHYREIVQLAKNQGFNFILHKDKFTPERKDIIWRHDVEFSPYIALKMSRIEHELGVQATYFFQLHSEFYNTLERYISDILLEIRSLGHHIGLHYDSHYYNVQDEETLEKTLSQDRIYFENVFGFEIDTFSFHETTPFILSCEKDTYGDLLNVYSKRIKQLYQYCADSTGFWRYEILDEVLRDHKVRHLHVLTHDAMWSEEVLSPRQRVRTSIQNNAERVKDRYDQLLEIFGAKNVDE
ncbi:MAG: hypothetical protein PHG58_02405 [Clostridia bacterium]|nr:hypothetical protein [Clostridia bacterium]